MMTTVDQVLYWRKKLHKIPPKEIVDALPAAPFSVRKVLNKALLKLYVISFYAGCDILLRNPKHNRIFSMETYTNHTKNDSS